MSPTHGGRRELVDDTPNEAFRRHTELRDALKAARTALRVARERVSRTTEELRMAVNNVRFHNLTSHVLTKIATVSTDELPRHAAS